ncbi:MAG: AAA family ATPase [Candidatus Rokubacteria bacterium]|nr:AAA family ATPase [Candidatus Rokubacteria bacterium]
MSGAALLSQEPELPIRWIWEPFLPEGGLALLVAYMKVGKTTFAYALAVAVAQGRPFLGFPTMRGGVLLLALEEHPREVRRRLSRLNLGPEDPLYVHEGPLTYTPATFEALRGFIREYGIRLVILDTLSMFWPVTDENANAEVIRSIKPLLALARDTGASVVLIHHERKAGGEDGRGIRGGSALFGLVDQALLLDRRQGGKDTQRVLRALGRYAETPRELILELVGDEYRKVGTAEELGLEAMKTKVLAALAAAPQEVARLAGQAGLSEKATKKALSALGPGVVREGKGVRGKPRTYRQADPDSIPSQPHP